jgi:uncharacterized protein
MSKLFNTDRLTSSVLKILSLENFSREAIMSVHLSTFNNPQPFLAAAGEMLYEKESANNLMLGISERLIIDPDAYQNPFFATVVDHKDALVLAAIMTPPHNIILAGCENFEKGFTVLITHLQANQICVPGVIAPVDLAERFVKTWKAIVGQPGRITMRQRIYELCNVRMPPKPPGNFRPAGLEDSPKIGSWLQEFSKEALGETNDLDLQRAERIIRNDQVFTWENEGKIVSMALKTRPIAHSITISGVYTPPEHRQKGYATALVAQLSERLLKSGYQYVNLFTDLDNPTSNAIYQKIGFYSVCDFQMHRFHSELGA